MLLSRIIYGEKAEMTGNDVDIRSVYSYSKKKVDSGLFFCLDGRRLNGEDFIEEAEKFGAAAAVCERIPKRKTGLTIVVVPDVRAAYAVFCSRFYSEPEKRLKIIGVVGTNGKTSTTKITEYILSKAGYKVGVIGTEGSFMAGAEYAPRSLTTPDPEDLYPLLKRFADDGATHVVMEVSAHAIELKKTEPIFFETLVFTNCTEDHLDYFHDPESYKNVKKSIFLKKKSKYYVINTDDDCGLETALELLKKGVDGVKTYGIFRPSDVFAAIVTESADKTSFVLNYFDELFNVKTRLLGTFNVYNCLAAVTCACLEGVGIEVAADAIRSVPPVKGRMQLVSEHRGAKIFVDYAHTPDGLEKSLLYLRKVTKGNLFTVFGCGGNRDVSKRPLMGKTAGDIADFVVLTSDNPRFEDRMKIISDVEAGLKEATLDYVVIKDRRAAISYAISQLESGDTLLIAGKGAEDYQEVMGVKHDFCDELVVREITGENI